jgi:hypothetical protein
LVEARGFVPVLLALRLREMQSRNQREVDLQEAVRAKRDERRPHTAGIGDELAHLDAHAARGIRLQVIRAGLQLDGRPTVVAPQQVIAANANLQNAFVERPNRTGFGPPDRFERLMALEELARVELLDGM